jgi:peroxiredoxin Q/BCP
MAQLRQDFQQFEQRNTTILVVGPEDEQAFRRYFTENSLPFIGIPDPAHNVLIRYGQEVNLFKMGRMPAQLLIDRFGMVRYIHYGHSMSDIPENTEILALIDGLNSEVH